MAQAQQQQQDCSKTSRTTGSSSSSSNCTGSSSSSSNASNHHPRRNPHNNNHNHNHRNNRKWWHKSLVQRTASFVESDFAQVVEQSPFLQRSAWPGQEHIALFSRSEIITQSRQQGGLVGRGGFSDVWAIHDFRLDPTVSARLTPPQRVLREHYRTLTRQQPGRFVMKHLQERLLDSRNPKSFQCAASDLALEAAYMSALDHENVVQVRGLPVEGLQAFGSSSGSNGTNGSDGYFIMLDRVHETLSDRLDQWREQEQRQDASSSTSSSSSASALLQEKGRIALQIARALSYLHDRRILFRDLKPANIGLMRDGTVKLLDFGLVRELPSSSYSSSSPDGEQQHSHNDDVDGVYQMSGVGTRRYMAPEIFVTHRYNRKADVYSWSMILYEMLALEKPYPLLSVDDHNRRVCRGGERPSLEALQGEDVETFGDLLRRSWCASIADRLSMDEAHDELQRILANHRAASSSTGKAKLEHAPTSPVGAIEELFVSALSLPDLSLPMCASEEDLRDDEHEPAPLKLLAKWNLNDSLIDAMRNSSSSKPPALAYRREA